MGWGQAGGGVMENAGTHSGTVDSQSWASLKHAAEYFRHRGGGRALRAHLRAGEAGQTRGASGGRAQGFPRLGVHQGRRVGLHVDVAHRWPGNLEAALPLLWEAGGVGQSQAPRPFLGRCQPLSFPGLLAQVAGPGQLLRVHALGQRQRLRLAVHAQPTVVAAEAAVVRGLGQLPLSQEAQRRPRARCYFGVVLGRGACEGQAVQELGARVVGLGPRPAALGVLAWPRRRLRVVHLQDVGGASAQATSGLLGDVVR